MYRKVSLIIPIYNAGKYLTNSLNTILEQDYPNIEVIVVNDASTDDTDFILRENKDRFRNKGFSFIIVNRAENGGLCAAINSGLEVASGEYLCFPDADDELSSQYVSSMVQVLESKPSIEWVRCNYTIILEEENREYDVILPRNSVYKNDFFDFISKYIPHNAWNMMVKKEYFQKTIGDKIIDSRLTQEWSLLLPLSYHSEYARCEDILYKYHIRKGAMSSWQNGPIEDVIKHFDDLKALNFNVLNSLDVAREDMYVSECALEIYYTLVKVKKYQVREMEEVRGALNTLQTLCENYIPWSVAELIDNYDLYVRLVFDVLLEMRSDVPRKSYEECEQLFSNGYVIYVDNNGKKLLTCIKAAFGHSLDTLECTNFNSCEEYSNLPKASLIENSGKLKQLLEKDKYNTSSYIDFRVLRDAIRWWARLKGEDNIEYEMGRIS